MKRNCLFALFASVHIFATDIRQVMFGNNYETINEIDADSFLDEHPDIKKYVSQIKLGDFMIRGHDKEYFRCFEQIIGDKRFVRVVKAVNPLSDEYILNWRNPDKISSRTHHAYITQMFYLPENQTAVVILPFCKMDADGYSWENGTDNKYEMIEIIQRNGNAKGFLLTRLVDKIDHRDRPEENGIYVEKYINTAEYYLFDDVIHNATESFGTVKYAGKYSTIRYVSIEATQPLIDSKCPFRYTINNAFDGNSATAYVEDTKDDTFGLAVIFFKSFNGKYNEGHDRKISHIRFINGYAASEQLYFDNNRFSKISFMENINSEDEEEKEKLRKTFWESYKDLALPDSREIYTYELVEPIRFNSFTFMAEGIVKGNKYNDTCLAEFDMFDADKGWIFGEVRQ